MNYDHPDYVCSNLERLRMLIDQLNDPSYSTDKLMELYRTPIVFSPKRLASVASLLNIHDYSDLRGHLCATVSDEVKVSLAYIRKTVIAELTQMHADGAAWLNENRRRWTFDIIQTVQLPTEPGTHRVEHTQPIQAFRLSKVVIHRNVGGAYFGGLSPETQTYTDRSGNFDLHIVFHADHLMVTITDRGRLPNAMEAELTYECINVCENS